MKKDAAILVRCTEVERAEITRLAQASDLSLSRFLVSRAMSSAPSTATTASAVVEARSLLQEALRVLGGAAVPIPVVEAPVAPVEAPVVEAPVVEPPVVEAPVVEAPVADANLRRDAQKKLRDIAERDAEWSPKSWRQSGDPIYLPHEGGEKEGLVYDGDYVWYVTFYQYGTRGVHLRLTPEIQELIALAS